MILSCQSHSKKINRNEFTLYSVNLIKSGTYNQDLLACCFTTTQPTVFINKLNDYHIKEVDFPMTRQLGLNFSRWKMAKYDLDSTIFVIGLFINNFQITSLTDDSITLLTQKLKSDPSITIILENNDSIKLDRYDFKALNIIKANFSVNDTSWTGIDY
jgi:hypothetical protein